MKTVLSKVSADKAPKELKSFAVAAAVGGVISLLVLWPLGIVGMAFGARALLLGFHKANKGQKNTLLYQVLAVIGIAAGLISLAFGLSK
ncbi:MAG: hypothetical protein ACREGJ_04275 [Candidatus Saccharimonadales bacterium]